MKPICGNETYVVTRNDRTRVTMVENRNNRTIYPVDDKDWPSFVQMVLTANKQVVKMKEAAENE